MKFATLLLIPAMAFGLQGSPKSKKTDPLKPTPTFAKDVKPFLTTYCVKCHGGERPAGGKNLAWIKDEAAAKVRMRLLLRALRATDTYQMPPEKEKQPTKKEFKRFEAWIKATWAVEKSKQGERGG